MDTLLKLLDKHKWKAFIGTATAMLALLSYALGKLNTAVDKMPDSQPATTQSVIR